MEEAFLRSTAVRCQSPSFPPTAADVSGKGEAEAVVRRAQDARDRMHFPRHGGNSGATDVCLASACVTHTGVWNPPQGGEAVALQPLPQPRNGVRHGWGNSHNRGSPAKSQPGPSLARREGEQDKAVTSGAGPAGQPGGPTSSAAGDQARKPGLEHLLQESPWGPDPAPRAPLTFTDPGGAPSPAARNGSGSPEAPPSANPKGQRTGLVRRVSQ